MIAVFRAEMAKQARRARTWVALGFMVAIPIVITIALKVNPPRLAQGRDPGDAFFFLSESTGLMVPVASLLLMSRLFLVVVLALFAGDTIASEAAWGNLRYLLLRPISRERLLGGKLAMAAAFSVAAVSCVVLSGLVAGVIAFGWHRLDVPVSGYSQTQWALLGHLALASLYVLWSLTSVIALSFMVSTMTDVPAGAIGAGVGLYVVSQILDALTALGAMRYGLPTHYYDAWRELFAHAGPHGDLARGILVQVPYIGVFGAVAWWWFRRKDILS